jgi:cardiolipin synthase C
MNCSEKAMVSLFFLLFFELQALASPIDSQSAEVHWVQSLETGTAAMAARLKLIEKAKKSIIVEYFIYDTSDASRLFTEALVKKKKDNPEIMIRIIVDYFQFSKSLNAFFSHGLISQGIEVRHYNNVFLLNLNSVTHRNHRKILSIDGEEAILGGRNMANEYFDMASKFNFSDRDIWVKGPIVSEIDRSFEYFWNFQRTRVPRFPEPPARRHSRNDDQHRLRERQYQRNMQRALTFSSLLNPENKNEKELLDLRDRILHVGDIELKEEPIYLVNKVRYVADGPDYRDKSHRISGLRFYELMEQAQKSISIEVPYFYLQKEEKKFFEKIKEKDIEVNLLINAKRASKEFAINYITLLQGLDFSRMGFNLFLNHGDLFDKSLLPFQGISEKAIWGVHAKTLIVDDDVTWIGSLNMDPRSVQRLNAEIGLIVFDKSFNTRLKRHYQTRLDSAYTVVDGRIQNAHRFGADPSELRSISEFLATLKMIPLYIFENQL